MIDILLAIQIISSLILFGVIWTIQLVHYPAFRYISYKDFIDFEAHHTFNISLIVIPLMILELISAAILVYFESHYLTQLNMVIVFFIWMVTFLFSVPCHKILANGKNHLAIEKLNKTNWLRTMAWSIKGCVLLFYFYHSR